MRICTLVENTSCCGAATAHGLALYLETPSHKMLFDLGPDDTLFVNAEAKGIDLSAVDMVIISHGHYDHGGALEKFFSVNNSAKVYIQRGAFLPHFRVMNGEWKYNGIDRAFADHPQVVLLDGDHEIDGELSLYTVVGQTKNLSEANSVLYEVDAPDRFIHEQSLILQADGKTALIMGCGHTGIINILEKTAAYRPDVCIGGYHLMNPTTGKCVRRELLDAVAAKLAEYPETLFYTCHCTGQEAYRYLADRLSNMCYLACGDEIEL